MIRETVQKTLDYVDDNVKEDISAETLAEIAGYSVFHFYRLFQSAVGMLVCRNTDIKPPMRPDLPCKVTKLTL